MRAQLRNGIERVVPEQPLGEELLPLLKVGNAYLSERGVASKLLFEMVSSHSPLGEGLTLAQRPRHSSRQGGAPTPTLRLEPTRLEPKSCKVSESRRKVSRSCRKVSQSCRKVSQSVTKCRKGVAKSSQSRRTRSCGKACHKVVANLPQTCHRVVAKLSQSFLGVCRKVCAARFAQVYVTLLPKPLGRKPFFRPPDFG